MRFLLLLMACVNALAVLDVKNAASRRRCWRDGTSIPQNNDDGGMFPLARSAARLARGGGDGALSPKRSPVGAFLARLRAFVRSFFDPAFGGAYASGSIRASDPGPGAAPTKAPVDRAKAGASARTITAEDLKAMEGGSVTPLKTEAELTRAVAAAKLSVVDFWASWCGPCVQMKPKFAKISDKYKSANFYAVDVDKAKPVSQKHAVSSMPTFVFFKNGKEIDRFSGADENKLATLIERYS